MMVNEINNNPQPWQSIIPQRMPWMNSYGPGSLATQFGQQSDVGIEGQSIQIGQHFVQDQHSFMADHPTATTLTSPVTICPTSSAANSQFISTTGLPPNCVTTTTNSYALMQNLAQISQPPMLQSCNLPNHNLSNQTQTTTIYNPGSSLTHLAHSADSPTDKLTNHKRSSIEIEEGQSKVYEPPTKQLLSERRLFKQFGSLQIDGVVDESGQAYDEDSDDLEDGHFQSNHSDRDRKEFNRYVYLLFKDKKNYNGQFITGCSGLDRLAREERDKLSKAVVLWNPPVKNFLDNFNANEDSDDDEFNYTDHKDFLKNRNKSEEQSIIIEDITADCITATAEDVLEKIDSDDIMIE